jgi:hypothetical protein
LRIPSPYFLSRGHSPAVLDRFDVGHSAKLGRSVVPLYDDADETCVGFLSRSEQPACRECALNHPKGAACRFGEPKWKLSGGFPKDAYLYGYAAVRRLDSPFVLLVEGAGDVFRAAEAGVPAVACLGVGLSAAQAGKLAALGRAVLVAFDNDEAGRRGARDARDGLRGARVRARIWPPPEGRHDLGEMAAEEALTWLGPYLPSRTA